MRTETLPAVRGAILDRQGLPLAETVTRHAIWSDSAMVTNGVAEAKVLAELLGGDAATYQDRLLYGGRFSYLARGVDQPTAAKVADARLPGVFLLDEPTRFTPADGLALSVVGQTDTDNVGTAGLEASFDVLLAGEPGRIVQEESRDGHTIPSGNHRVDPRPGRGQPRAHPRPEPAVHRGAASSRPAWRRRRRRGGWPWSWSPTAAR